MPAPEPDLIDALVAEQVADWQPLMAPLLAPLLAELDNAVAQGVKRWTPLPPGCPSWCGAWTRSPSPKTWPARPLRARLAGEADLDLAPSQGA